MQGAQTATVCVQETQGLKATGAGITGAAAAAHEAHPSNHWAWAVADAAIAVAQARERARVRNMADSYR
jgi:hypothetical protein